MAIPDEGMTGLATLDEIYAWFREYLGRDPDWATEAVPRVGNSKLSQLTQIRCSQEASNYRAAHGVEPDTWCFNRNPVTGLEMPGVKPKEPENKEGVIGPDKKPDKPPWEQIGDAVLGDILERILAELETLGEMKDGIIRDIDTKIDESFPELGQTLDKLRDHLEKQATGLIPNTISLVGAALGGMETILAAFLSNAADIGDIGDLFVDLVSDNKVNILGSVMELVVGDDFNLAGEVGKKVAEAFSPGEGDVIDLASRVSASFPDIRVEEI